MPASLPPPQVETLVVQAPRLPPLGGEAVFAVEQLDARALKTAPRLDAALKRQPGVSLFRRTGSDAANPTIQGVSLRGVAPSGAGRALVTLDGVPQNDPFGGWVIWTSLPTEAIEGASVVSAVSRESAPIASRSCDSTTSRSVRAATSSRRTSNCPAATLSSSLTKIFLTMPPS